VKFVVEELLCQISPGLMQGVGMGPQSLLTLAVFGI